MRSHSSYYYCPYNQINIYMIAALLRQKPRIGGESRTKFFVSIGMPRDGRIIYELTLKIRLVDNDVT